MINKKILKNFILFLMMFFLASCGNIYGGNAVGVSTRDLDSAWGEEFRFNDFYGEVNGYKVFMVASSEELNLEFSIQEAVFKYVSPFNIYLYKDGSFISLEEAYENKELEIDDIQTIEEIHSESVKQLLELSSMSEINNTVQDYFGNEIPLTKQSSSNQTDDEVYHGDFEGYSVYFCSSPWAAGEKFILGDVVFYYSSLFDIYLTKDGKSVTIEEAYQNNLVSDKTIRNIGYYHAEYVKSELGHAYDSEESFYESYHNLEFVNRIYDKSRLVDHDESNIVLPYMPTLIYSDCINEIEMLLGQKFDYDLYCGTINDYHLFVVNDDVSASAYKVDENYFIHDHNFSIYAYKNCELFDFFELCVEGEFSDQQVADMAIVFKLLQRFNTYKDLNDSEFVNIYNNPENYKVIK